MEYLIIGIISVVVTESLTELISKSEFFSPLREWFFNRRKYRICTFIHSLLDCGYCLSVWVGFFVGLVLVKLSYINPVVDYIMVGLVIHRASNLLHNIMDRTRKEF